MKIIAKVNSSSVLLEAEYNEVSMLVGKGRYVSDGEREFPVGVTIQLSKLWDIISHERGRPDQIDNTAKALRAIADQLDAVNGGLANPIVEAKG